MTFNLEDFLSDVNKFFKLQNTVNEHLSIPLKSTKSMQRTEILSF